VFSTQDAHGPIRRGALFVSCSTLQVLDALQKVNPQLGTIIQLANFPQRSQVCAGTAQAPGTNTATAASASDGGRSP
jgi:phospholipid/cholesterol/gamma-HCH transport system substrate-binding protein